MSIPLHVYARTLLGRDLSESAVYHQRQAAGLANEPENDVIDYDQDM